MKPEKATFANEAALCLAFIEHLPEGWTAYPETADFDIVLSRDGDGVQIGIEAKLTLNAKVITQITEDYWDVCRSGPDFRAVLVPYGSTGSMRGVCSLLGITIIEMMTEEFKAVGWHREWFTPELPKLGESHWGGDRWIDWCPKARVKLPEYVPDVGAGNSAPIKLTEWKIKAIKVAVIVEQRGYVTRDDFKALGIDHRRWLTPGISWLARGERKGVYTRGDHMPDFKGQHPKNYEQIAADAKKWMPIATLPAVQGEMI